MDSDCVLPRSDRTVPFYTLFSTAHLPQLADMRNFNVLLYLCVCVLIPVFMTSEANELVAS